MHILRRFAVEGVILLVGIALQIGGYHNERGAWLLIALGVLLGAIAFATWPPVIAGVRVIPRLRVRVKNEIEQSGPQPTSNQEPPKTIGRPGVESLYVDFDNALWQYGGLYNRRDAPYSKPPVCPTHLTGLFYEDRDGHRQTPGAITYQHLKTYGQLWCPEPEGDGHGLGPHTSDTYETMHDYAEALLLGAYNKWKVDR
jgi:hypothetical protein